MCKHELFPRLLYGDFRSTRDAWRNVARRAWNVGEWGDSFARAGMVSLPDLPGDILLERGFFGTGRRGSEPLWRLYWSSKSIRMAYRGEKTSESDERAARLILSGMEHLWFTLGMWCAEYGDLHDPVQPEHKVTAYYEQLLRWFVNWLPEVLHLSDRFASEAFTSSEWRAVRPMAPAGNLLRCACFAGYRIPQFGDERFNWVEFVQRRYDGDFIEWLVDLGIIRRQGSRFMLEGRPL